MEEEKEILQGEVKDADKEAVESVGRPRLGPLPQVNEPQGTGCRESPARQPEMAG